MFQDRCFRAIEQISSIKESQKHFESADADTKILGVFDIDDTLLIPKDPAFQKPNMKKHASIVQGFKEQLSVKHQDLLSNLILTLSSSQLIESTSPLFIKNLQAQEIRLMALTAAMTRPFGVHYLPKMRYEELQRHGIDFSSAFPEVHQLSLTHVNMCSRSFPMFYSGVLCSNGDYQRQTEASAKGKVLCEFLKKVNWTPTKIVFIDDKRYHLEEMEQTLHEFDPHITYQGLHYIGAQSILSPQVDEGMIEEKWEKLWGQVQLFIEETEELCTKSHYGK